MIRRSNLALASVVAMFIVTGCSAPGGGADDSKLRPNNCEEELRAMVTSCHDNRSLAIGLEGANRLRSDAIALTITLVGDPDAMVSVTPGLRSILATDPASLIELEDDDGAMIIPQQVVRQPLKGTPPYYPLPFVDRTHGHD